MASIVEEKDWGPRPMTIADTASKESVGASNVEDLLIELRHYYARTRGVGHTALLKQGLDWWAARGYPFLIVRAKGDPILTDAAVPLVRLFSKLKDKSCPLAWDNGALVELFSAVIELLYIRKLRINALVESHQKAADRITQLEVQNASINAEKERWARAYAEKYQQLENEIAKHVPLKTRIVLFLLKHPRSKTFTATQIANSIEADPACVASKLTLLRNGGNVQTIQQSASPGARWIWKYRGKASPKRRKRATPSAQK